jgi:hypothetical protein
MNEPELLDSTEVDPAEAAAFLTLPHPEFLDYEYRRYDPAKSVFIQARSDGRLVGSQALIPYPLVIDGMITLTGRSERSKVDASQRGGKLFPRLMDYCAAQGAAKGLQLIWGTTTLRKALERAGFWYYDDYYDHALLCVSATHAVRDLTLPQPRKLTLAKLATMLPSLAARTLAWLPTSRLQVESEVRGTDDVFQLFERVRRKQPLVVMHHDARLLDWLFSPPRKVLPYFGYAGNRLVAYGYVDITDPADCRLIDYGAEDGRSFRSLLRHMARDLKKHNVGFLHVMFNRRNPLLRSLASVLYRSGFVRFFRGGGFVIRPLTFHDPETLNDISKWYITGMWVQLYPGT